MESQGTQNRQNDLEKNEVRGHIFNFKTHYQSTVMKIVQKDTHIDQCIVIESRNKSLRL